MELKAERKNWLELLRQTILYRKHPTENINFPEHPFIKNLFEM